MVLKLFNQAIEAILKNWSALQLAVTQVSAGEVIRVEPNPAGRCSAQQGEGRLDGGRHRNLVL